MLKFWWMQLFAFTAALCFFSSLLEKQEVTHCKKSFHKPSMHWAISKYLQVTGAKYETATFPTSLVQSTWLLNCYSMFIVYFLFTFCFLNEMLRLFHCFKWLFVSYFCNKKSSPTLFVWRYEIIWLRKKESLSFVFSFYCNCKAKHMNCLKFLYFCKKKVLYCWVCFQL